MTRHPLWERHFPFENVGAACSVTAFVWGLSEFLFGSTFSLVPRLRRLNYCGNTEHVSFVMLSQTRPFTLLYRFQYQFVSFSSKRKMCWNLKIKMI